MVLDIIADISLSRLHKLVLPPLSADSSAVQVMSDAASSMEKLPRCLLFFMFAHFKVILSLFVF
jgi:hypothetical protein